MSRIMIEVNSTLEAPLIRRASAILALIYLPPTVFRLRGLYDCNEIDIDVCGACFCVWAHQYILMMSFIVMNSSFQIAKDSLAI
jgi:hypothetical protein